MATSLAAPAHPHPHFPRGLAISDLDLRDDRYPLISSSRHVPPAAHQGTKTANLVSSHSHIHPDAMHQPVRGPSLPSSDVVTPPFILASAQPDILQVSDERRSLLQPEPDSQPPQPSQPTTSHPVDHLRTTNSPSSMNEISLPFAGPSRASQISTSEVSKPPPTGDTPSPTQHPSSLQPGSPRHTSPRVTRPAEHYIPTRSSVAANQGQGVDLSSLSPNMRMSSAAQYKPTMAVPVTVSSNPRVQAHQPTYINPAPAPTPINPVFTSQPLPAEEICVECAMRDQDMADVDVTSPGIWARESDVHYDELLRRELEEEAMAISPQEQQRPRARGGRLTEANLKHWLTLNPKEPASKGEALDRYVTAQQTLVEAEALAHARAALESRQLEDRMRDAYSQLRRSAYELGAATSQDDRGIRIKTLRSSVSHLPGQTNSQSREVTVLENGMVVEHVDVRKEEREGRHQRRRGEKRSRARKSSRGSAFDVASMYSTTSPLAQTDSGLPLLPSLSSTSRPMSVLTSPADTLVTRGMQSNTSMEALSMISVGASPRRGRFFGVRNLSPSVRSSDSLAGASGLSGSMVDMHLALQPGAERLHSPVELGDRYQTIDSWRDSSALIPSRGIEQKSEDRQTKRKSLAKIWRFVTGTSKQTSIPLPDLSQSHLPDRVHDDDYPLAPPPPLSYLVSRGTGDNSSSALRHVSTSSLPSSVSPNYPLSSVGMSPPTATSSSLPSPTSSRPVVTSELSENRKGTLADSDGEQLASPVPEDNLQTSATQRSVHPTTSEPDLRRRVSQALSGPVPPVPLIPTSVTQTTRPSSSLGWREKKLPPLPGDAQSRSPTVAQGEIRPRTLFSYDMREVNGGQVFTAPQPPFAREERRRQSFNGLSNSRPSAIQSLPSRRNGFDPEKYGMFGGSRNALVPTQQQPAKRKSRFSFASLFGRKNSVPMQSSEPVDFSLGRSSGSDARHEAELGMHYGNLMAEAEAGGHAFPRLSMSLTTRKNIESLVDQSPEFVAYRYPSVDQNVHLLQ